jgi:hypothetical protein
LINRHILPLVFESLNEFRLIESGYKSIGQNHSEQSRHLFFQLQPFEKGSLPCVSCADCRLATIGLVCDWFWHSRTGKQNDYTLSLNEEPTFYRSEGDDRTEKNEEKPL